LKRIVIKYALMLSTTNKTMARKNQNYDIYDLIMVH